MGIKTIIFGIIILFAIVYSTLFIYGFINEKIELRNCEKEGLGLVYFPIDGFQLKRSSSCENITELNKIYKIKQAPVSRWWYFENER